MRFVETPIFTRQVGKLLEDEEYRSLVIYYGEKNNETFYMLLANTKSKQEDLTPEQVKVLIKLVKEEFK